MAGRVDMSGGMKAGRPLALQNVMRLITILVLVVGLGYLGVAYYKRMFVAKGTSGAPSGTRPGGGLMRRSVDNLTGEVTYDIDLRHYPLPAGTDNAPAVPPTADNAVEVAAIVGLESIRDGATIERQPLYWLLREVETRQPADGLFMKRAPDVTLAELRERPESFRAKPVTVSGTLIRLERSTLPENPSGIREVMEGDLLVGREGICMFLASRVVPVQVNQEVKVHGLFMKLVRYSGKGGVQEDAPLVVTSHPTPVGAAGGQCPAVSAPRTLFGVLAALFVIYFVMMFVLRRRQQGRNALWEARRKARALTRPTTTETDEAGGPQEAQEAEGPEETEEP